MKLLYIFDHPSFKLSLNGDIMRPNLVDILESLSFSCSTKSMDAIYKAVRKMVTANRVRNKYAIYAYTHGPVTGSGPSVKPLKYDVAPYWLS